MSNAVRLLKIDSLGHVCASAVVGINALALIASLSGCGASRSSSTSSQMTISFPNAAIHSASFGSTYNFAQACFAISVRASDIPNVSKNSCDVPRGIFSGFVAPGGSVSIQVPRGTGRSLEIFSYLRASATASCQTLPDFGTMAPNKLVRVGYIPSFDAQTDVVNLDVTLSAPATTDNLVTQYKLASTCSVASPLPGISSALITNGHTHSTGGSIVIEGSVTGQTNEVRLNGGNLQIQLSRRPN